ncbi:DUF4232 domain-containing protein [Motilibacter deserti]|uniref:DUF4232 domain-containing protein n=1 Tax=Motilibacter deserti TaxID=2714956 RepID=A0ABX0H0E0_9ACTN|nr:DUF4232 domain-containing protein [Motilibacter deserti]NHC15489.1 DUF4232 domain-containing protein [Motilibacter deserti]
MRSVKALVLLGGLALALSGCSDDGTAAAPSSPAVSPTATTGAPTPTAPTTGGSPGAPAATPGGTTPAAGAGATAPTGTATPTGTAAATDGSRCRADEVTASLVPGSPGAGQRYAALVLRNESARECVVQGYGGAQLRDENGKALPTKLDRVGGPERAVVLQPGMSAQSQLHWGAVAGSGEPTTGDCAPAPFTLAVTPPDQREQVEVRWSLGPVCDGGRIEQQPYAPAAA